MLKDCEDYDSGIMAALTIIGGSVFIMAVLAISIFLKGYVLSLLWGWFFVPVFGLQHLSIVTAVGITLMASILSPSGGRDRNEERKTIIDLETMKSVVYIIMKPLFVLFIGWLVCLFL